MGAITNRPVILTNINIILLYQHAKFLPKQTIYCPPVYKFKLSDVVIYVHVNCLGEFNQHSQHPRAKIAIAPSTDIF